MPFLFVVGAVCGHVLVLARHYLRFNTALVLGDVSILLIRLLRDIDNLDTDAFLTYLPTLANGIGGFFIVEQTLLQQVSNTAAKAAAAAAAASVAVPRNYRDEELESGHPRQHVISSPVTPVFELLSIIRFLLGATHRLPGNTCFSNACACTAITHRTRALLE